MTEETDDDVGRIVAFKNPAHEPGGKQPAFKGSITPEGSADKRPIALWVRTSKKSGDTFMTGKAGETASAQIDKIALGEPEPTDDARMEMAQTTGTQLAVDPHEAVLFKNKSKEPGSKQPDYFGYYNPGDGTKLQRLDVWARNDKYGKPMLSGNVTEYQEKAKKKKKALAR